MIWRFQRGLYTSFAHYRESVLDAIASDQQSNWPWLQATRKMCLVATRPTPAMLSRETRPVRVPVREGVEA